MKNFSQKSPSRGLQKDSESGLFEVLSQENPPVFKGPVHMRKVCSPFACFTREISWPKSHSMYIECHKHSHKIKHFAGYLRSRLNSSEIPPSLRKCFLIWTSFSSGDGRSLLFMANLLEPEAKRCFSLSWLAKETFLMRSIKEYYLNWAVSWWKGEIRGKLSPCEQAPGWNGQFFNKVNCLMDSFRIIDSLDGDMILASWFTPHLNNIFAWKLNTFIFTR